jgi:hypothetical protein
MKNIGYYYSDEIKTLIIGFEDEKGRLHGKVLGNTFESDYANDFAPFRYGYRYNSWHEGFTYVGRLSAYTTLKGYLDFLDNSNYKQIKSYFLVKNIILEQHNSYVKRRKIDGRTYKYVMHK